MGLNDPPKRHAHRGTRVHRDRRREATDAYHEDLIADAQKPEWRRGDPCWECFQRRPLERVETGGDTVYLRCPCGHVWPEPEEEDDGD